MSNVLSLSHVPRAQRQPFSERAMAVRVDRRALSIVYRNGLLCCDTPREASPSDNLEALDLNKCIHPGSCPA